jgi:hypothetical protein
MGIAGYAMAPLFKYMWTWKDLVMPRGGGRLNRITSNFPEKIEQRIKGRVTRTLRPDHPQGGVHPDYQCGSPCDRKTKINSLRVKWFYRNPLSQMFSKDVVDNLHKIICQATKHKSRSGQNKLLGLEEGMNSSKQETSELIRSLLPQRKLCLRWGSHKGRAITKSRFSSSNSHKGKLVLTKRNPQRMGNTNVPGCSTRRGHSTGDA